MIIFQDFEQATDKAAFINNAINEFKGSQFYKNGVDALKYYLGENTTILNRMQWFYNSSGSLEQDKFKANNQVCSDYYTKIVKQVVSYLLANGITIDKDDIKKGLPRKFDVKMQDAGTKAQTTGVAWGYCFINQKGNFDIDIWSGTEAFPMYDERTGIIRALVRFWQVEEDKPLFVELYEQDGKTEFKSNDRQPMQILTPKTAYKVVKEIDITGESVSEVGNFSVLPIFPMWANDVKRSSFSKSLKSKIDLYDIVMSDFGNNLEDSQDVYWILKNYNGQDMGEFLADYKYYKAIKTDDDGEAQAHTIEVPYQARQTALDILKKQIYDGAMALDTSVLSGGSLTNIAIKANMMDLDLKTDDFENQVYDFLYNVIDLYLEFVNKPNQEYQIELIRRSLINDTEIVDNIYKFRQDISHETALKLNPYIKDESGEIEKIDEEGLNKYTLEETLEEE